jgi:hypothetical protein
MRRISSNSRQLSRPSSNRRSSSLPGRRQPGDRLTGVGANLHRRSPPSGAACRRRRTTTSTAHHRHGRARAQRAVTPSSSTGGHHSARRRRRAARNSSARSHCPPCLAEASSARCHHSARTLPPLPLPGGSTPQQRMKEATCKCPSRRVRQARHPRVSAGARSSRACWTRTRRRPTTFRGSTTLPQPT